MSTRDKRPDRRKGAAEGLFYLVWDTNMGKATRAKETEDWEQGPQRQGASRSPQQRGPPGAKEKDTRTVLLERLQELSATEASRSKRARNKGKGLKLPRAYCSRCI